MIDQIEYVSHHFNYTEEYVLDHTPAWIQRKYMQAARNDYEQQRTDIVTGFKSLALFIDSALNKGKGAASILPLPFDEAIKSKKEESHPESQFKTGQWWIQK